MRRVLALLIGALMAVQCSAAIWNISYPRPLTESDQRTRYPVALLALALDQTGVNYKLIPSAEVLNQDKALVQLSENRGVNVVWSMTDSEREKRLLPIRIPIYKGMIGWRVFLLREEMAGQFAQIDTLQQLQKFRPIQGADWPDTKILQSNGFDVSTSKNYLSLFAMLTGKQGDFFPRSLVEVWSEVENEDVGESVIVESTLGIRYPTAMYFFVNKNNKTLARLLREGLEKAVANGKFDELFDQVFSSTLERSNLEKRFFFQLDNPLLPKETPLQREELWYR